MGLVRVDDKGKVYLVDQARLKILRTVLTPPPIFISLPPATALACVSVSSIPPETKWKVVPSTIPSF